MVAPPPEEDDDFIRPFAPRVGKLFRAVVRRCGYNDRDVAVVSAIRTAVAAPSMEQLRCCRPFLLHAVKRLKPKNILGLGKFALRVLSNRNEQNITKARAKSLEVPGV